VSDAPNGDLIPMLGLREPVSALTHLIAAPLAAIGARLLWVRTHGESTKRASMVVYGASLVWLYLISGLYHMVRVSPDALVFLRKLDHAAIFILIAGTFTPFFVNAAVGRVRAGNLILIWSVAIAGIALKILYIGMPDAWSSGLYVGMGWLALIGYAELASALSHRAMAVALLGGVLYSAGAVVDAARWPVPLPGVFGSHEVLHVLVMVASALHFWVVLRFVVPYRRAGVFTNGGPG
jgi:hemolysin III